MNAEELVYNKLREAIFKRNIRPAARLVESKIAEQLGVSRTPVRGALKRLAHDGFVTLSSNIGASIVTPTGQEISDTFAVRLHLEKLAAARAIKLATGSDIVELKNYLAREDDIFKTRDIGLYYDLNHDLHLYIAEIAHNPVLKEYLDNIISRSHIYLILYENFYQLEINPSYEEHERIIKAIISKDSLACNKALEQHFQSTLAGLRLEEPGRELTNELILN